MKLLNYIFPAILALLLIPAKIQAQEQITVPLSNPGEPGKLTIGIVRGSISVSGYDGQEVLINYAGDIKENKEKQVTKNGLRRISNNSVGFAVKEDDNKVEVSGASPRQNIDFDVSVPRNFSIKLSTVNGGNILVENVNGEIEVSNVNGEVTLQNVSGSGLVNTVHGNIKATFKNVNPDKPMAFSNLNGDIDITLPANISMNTKMKSEWGEVFTDFDMDIRRTDDKNIKSSKNSGTFEVSIDNWIYGSINGGGPEYLFKSMRGDIYIRKR